MSDRFHGVVKFFCDKGYGFITPDDGGGDIFVHQSDLPAGISELLTDQHVSYVVADSDRKKGNGKKAAQVQIDD